MSRLRRSWQKALLKRTKPFREELEKFFIAMDELEDKKLDIIGWKGPKVAQKAIKDAAKSFAKKEQ